MIPDTLPHRPCGQILERMPGLKRIAIRTSRGGTVEEKVAPELVERLCLDDDRPTG